MGHFITGFEMNIGTHTNNMAELFAIRVGLDLAIKHNICNLIIHTDSQVTVNLICRNPPAGHKKKNLIQDCKAMMGKFQNCRMEFKPRGSNQVADVMSKHALNLPFENGCMYFDSPPLYLLPILGKEQSS